MTSSLRILSCYLVIMGSAFAYQPSSISLSRRDWFTFAFAAAATTTLIPEQPANAEQPTNAGGVLSSKYCAYGAGKDCDDLSEGNELIRQLQAKSAANKEKNVLEAKNAYYMKNYPDVFAVDGKTMLKKSDGSFVLVSDEEMTALRRENKIGVETVKTLGGKVVDLTQKRILVLKE